MTTPYMTADSTRPHNVAVVTGATGFIGTALCAALIDAGWHVRALARASTPVAGAGAVPRNREIEWHTVRDLALHPTDDLARVLTGAAVVFNLVGRAHRSRERHARRQADVIEARYFHDNVEVAGQIGRAAALAGVARLVHVSSVKAIADVSEEPLVPEATPRPIDAYGRSKRAAEACLERIARERLVRVTVVRPPLVYGPGVRGNLATLLRAIQRGLPLPLAAARAPRSMIGIDNLCDLLVRVASVEHENWRIFHVSDDRDLCVAELVTRCAELMGLRPRLWRLGPHWFEYLDRMTGSAWHDRLFRPLRVDAGATHTALGWRPRCSVDEGLARMLART
jgi:nucleoside-diphosphate-sugar epimerase